MDKPPSPPAETTDKAVKESSKAPGQAAIGSDKKPGAPSAEAKKTGAGNKAAVVLAGLSLALAVAAIAGSAYLWQQSQQQTQLLDQVLDKSRADLAGAVQRVDSVIDQNRELQRQLDLQSLSADNTRQALEQELKNLQQQLASQHKRLMAMSTTDRDDWLLAEAEYLMRLANQRLLMGKEVQGALELLKAADSIVRELDDSALFPVREALAKDMEALRAAGSLDLEGIYLRLEALASRVQKLQLQKLPSMKMPAETEPVVASWQQRLQAGLDAAIEKLSGYIKITRREEHYTPMLAPEYEATLRQTIRLMLEQAQSAALSGKQQLFENSLDKAKHWLSTYYTLDQQTTTAMLETIEQLSANQVEVNLPDISSSLRALKNYIETIHPPAPAKNNQALNKNTVQENADSPAADPPKTDYPKPAIAKSATSQPEDVAE